MPCTPVCDTNTGRFVMANTSGDYTAPEGPVLGASGDLMTAAASGSPVHWVALDVTAIWSVRVRASSAGSSGARWTGLASYQPM